MPKGFPNQPTFARAIALLKPLALVGLELQRGGFVCVQHARKRDLAPLQSRAIETARAWLQTHARPRQAANREAHTRRLSVVISEATGQSIEPGEVIRAALELGMFFKLSAAGHAVLCAALHERPGLHSIADTFLRVEEWQQFSNTASCGGAHGMPNAGTENA